MKLKDFLTKENWCKNDTSKYKHRYCLITACDVVYKDLTVGIYNKIKKELGFPSIVGIFHWNDAFERTFEDVHNLCVKLDI